MRSENRSDRAQQRQVYQGNAYLSSECAMLAQSVSRNNWLACTVHFQRRYLQAIIAITVGSAGERRQRLQARQPGRREFHP